KQPDREQRKRPQAERLEARRRNHAERQRRKRSPPAQPFGDERLRHRAGQARRLGQGPRAQPTASSVSSPSSCDGRSRRARNRRRRRSPSSPSSALARAMAGGRAAASKPPSPSPLPSSSPSEPRSRWRPREGFFGLRSRASRVNGFSTSAWSPSAPSTPSS